MTEKRTFPTLRPVEGENRSQFMERVRVQAEEERKYLLQFAKDDHEVSIIHENEHCRSVAAYMVDLIPPRDRMPNDPSALPRRNLNDWLRARGE